MKITPAFRWPRLSDWRWPRLRPCARPRSVRGLTSVAAAARPTGPSSRVRISAPCRTPGRPNMTSRPPKRNCVFREIISWMRDPAPSLCVGCANPVAARCKWLNAWLSIRRWTKSPPCSARVGSGKCRRAGRVGVSVSVSESVGGKRKAGRGPRVAVRWSLTLPLPLTRAAGRQSLVAHATATAHAGRRPPIAHFPPGFCRACRCANRHLTAFARLVTPASRPWRTARLATGIAPAHHCCPQQRLG
jgi:hypothetical protein